MFFQKNFLERYLFILQQNVIPLWTVDRIETTIDVYKREWQYQKYIDWRPKCVPSIFNNSLFLGMYFKAVMCLIFVLYYFIVVMLLKLCSPVVIRVANLYNCEIKL